MPDRQCPCGATISYSGHGRPRVRCETCSPPASKRLATRRHTLPGCPLTDRQREMITLLADGLVYKQIAARLNLSVSTVRTHLHAAYTRLGVLDRAQAVLVCEREGWIGSDSWTPASRELVLLHEIRELLRRYVDDLPKHRTHRVSPKQRDYLDAFDAYIRHPDRAIENDVIRAFEVLTEEAGVVVGGRQRLPRHHEPHDLREAA
jgi:DNA-binding CsgD family transcriptional regulator